MANSMSQRKAAEVAIQERVARLNDSLSERSRRLFAASEAMAFGFGGVAAVSRATGMSSATIRNGIQESQAIESGRLEPLATTRSRRAGGGRKQATDKDPTLLTDLQEWVESTTRGDPEGRLLWTACSLRHLALALTPQGHDVKKNTVARVRKQLG